MGWYQPTASFARDKRAVVGLLMLLMSFVALASLLSTHNRSQGFLRPEDKLIARYFTSHWHPGRPQGLGCGKLERVGRSGDGGKAICLDASPPATSVPCAIISIGSNGEFSFENSMHQLAPHCDVHTFDGTMNTTDRQALLKRTKPTWVHFHPQNIDPGSRTEVQGLLGRKALHVWALKMDCEGCEVEALLPLMGVLCIDLILLEIHVKTLEQLAPTQRMLESINRTHGLYYTELNLIWLSWKGNPGIWEMAWRRRPGMRGPGCVEQSSGTASLQAEPQTQLDLNLGLG